VFPGGVGSGAGGEHLAMGETRGGGTVGGRQRYGRARLRQNHAKRDRRGGRVAGGGAPGRGRRRDRGEHDLGPGAVVRERRQ